MVRGIPQGLLRTSEVSFEPTGCVVRLKKLETRKVGVRLRYAGEAAVGFEVDEAGVRVNGKPLSEASVEAQAVSSVFAGGAGPVAVCADVVLRGKRGPFEVAGVKLDPMLQRRVGDGTWTDTGVRAKGLEPAAVQVYVPVRERFVTKSVAGVAVRLLEPPDYAYDVLIKESTRKVTAHVAGPEALLKDLKAADIDSYIVVDPAAAPFNKVQSGIILQITPEFLLPKGVRWDDTKEKPGVIIEGIKDPSAPAAPAAPETPG